MVLIRDFLGIILNILRYNECNDELIYHKICLCGNADFSYVGDFLIFYFQSVHALSRALIHTVSTIFSLILYKIVLVIDSNSFNNYTMLILNLILKFIT